MLWQSILWIWLSGLLFAVFHSITASTTCKQWFYQRGIQEPRYRLIYSIVAILTTAVWVYFVHQLADTALYQSAGFGQVILMAIQGIGLVLMLAAFHPIDGLVFLGLRPALIGTDPFVERGIYRWLRHPMYVGAMLILLAMPSQSWNGLHFSLLICVYFIIGSRFEEQRMLREHPDYAAYRQRVAAFIPMPWKRP
ncbi:MAG: NnrU family protein [Mariprofundus sp.]|nr:NnrU family protein [Mariprofundus sp.]